MELERTTGARGKDHAIETRVSPQRPRSVRNRGGGTRIRPSPRVSRPVPFVASSRIRAKTDDDAMVPLQVHRNTPSRVPAVRSISGDSRPIRSADRLRHRPGTERHRHGDRLTRGGAPGDHHRDQVFLELADPQHTREPAVIARGHLLIVRDDDRRADELHMPRIPEMVDGSDVGAHGLAAPALAAGTALQTAPRFGHRLVHGQSQADLLEVPASHLGLPQGHLLTRLLRKFLGDRRVLAHAANSDGQVATGRTAGPSGIR